MERIPIEEPGDLHDIVVGVYNVLFADDLEPDDIDLYYIDSEHVEAEIELPYIGLNRDDWQAWSVERKLEVLLHEFAHVEEADDEPDHGSAFYDRLAELTRIAHDHREAIETLFDTSIDFEQIHDHIVDSVNEYTIEVETDSVEGRRQVLREELSTAGTAN